MYGPKRALWPRPTTSASVDRLLFMLARHIWTMVSEGSFRLKSRMCSSHTIGISEWEWTTEIAWSMKDWRWGLSSEGDISYASALTSSPPRWKSDEKGAVRGSKSLRRVVMKSATGW